MLFAVVLILVPRQQDQHNGSRELETNAESNHMEFFESGRILAR